MTEADWRTCEDPQAMLNYLEGKVSERKLRLFACACCGRHSHHLGDPRSRQALQVSEHFADGLATAAELADARDAAELVLQMEPPLFSAFAYQAAWATTQEPAIEAARATVQAGRQHAVREAVYDAVPGGDERREEADAIRAECRAQCDLLRHIVGNPFRPVVLDPAWLSWNSHLVPTLARTLYDEGRFQDILYLGDALADAGCDDELLVTHCHAPARHPRGCWVLDAVLQRQ